MKYNQKYFEGLYAASARERRVILTKYLAKMSSGRRVLDLGCGTGEAMDILENLGWETWGVEISDYAIKKAKMRNKIANIDLNYQKLPYANDFFDLVLLLDVVEHLEKDELVFKEVGRVLRPGGKLFLTTPNRFSWYWRIFKKLLPHDPTHINEHNLGYWIKRIEENGLRAVKKTGVLTFGWPPGWVARDKFRQMGWPTRVGPVYWPIITWSGTLAIWAQKRVI